MKMFQSKPEALEAAGLSEYARHRSASLGGRSMGTPT